jgi:hypothetical protein
MSRRQEHMSGNIEDCEREAVGCDGLFQNECDGNYKLREGKGSGLGEPFSCKDNLQRKCQ